MHICKAVQVRGHPRTGDVTSCYYTFDLGIFVGSVPRQAVALAVLDRALGPSAVAFGFWA